MARPPRIPVWLPWGQSVIYFITICVEKRKPVLANPNTFSAIEEFCDANTNWNTIAAVIMPDHIHALVAPTVDRDQRVTQFSAGLKRFVLRQTDASWRWQDGVFDRLLRRNESAQSKWLYIRENPVRAGLVARSEDWPYVIGFSESEHSPAA
jgi:REP element-mobilizing transposase RayT